MPVTSNAPFRLCLGSLALAAFCLPVRAQDPERTSVPNGFIRLVDAVARGTGKLRVSINGIEVREMGYRLGDVTGGIPVTPGACRISFGRDGLDGGQTTVTIGKDETITLIPFAESEPATVENEPRWRIRILRLKQRETMGKCTATIVNVTNRPELKVEMRRKNGTWQSLLVTRFGLEQAVIGRTSGYVPIRTGGGKLKPLSVGTSGNFVAVIYDDAEGNIQSREFPGSQIPERGVNLDVEIPPRLPILPSDAPTPQRSPYTFRPPRMKRWLRPLALAVNRRIHLQRKYRIAHIAEEGFATVRDLCEAGHSVLLAPNHSDHSDPHVIMELASRHGMQPYFMGAREIFEVSPARPAGRCRAWASSRWIATVRTSPPSRPPSHCSNAAADPLVMFPEGEIYHHHRRLDPLNEGVASILLKAAGRLAEGRKAHLVPVALRFFHDPVGRGNLPRPAFAP